MKRMPWNISRNEDGASAVLVVLSMFVLLGVAALAIDAGSLWMTKRNFVADTDAAALAGAMAAAESGCDTAQIQAEAETYLGANQGGSVSGSPFVDPDCSDDTVTVEFTGQAPMTFAGIFGFSQLDVFSSSTAHFDQDPLDLLRPLATCISNPIVGNAAEDAPAEVISFSGNEKGEDLSDCGSPSGNWGWLCFDSNCGANDDKVCDDPDGTSGYLRCGFDPGLDLGAAPILGPVPPYLLHDEICYEGGTTDDWCVTKTGSKNSLGNGSEGTPVYEAWEQRVFPILLVDTYDPDKSGRTAAHPKALLWVSFDGYCIDDNKNGVRNWDGDPKEDCKGQNFAFKMAPLHVQWSADEQVPDHVLQHVPMDVRLCGVDHDPAGGNRC